jgi:hypothetical protein
MKPGMNSRFFGYYLVNRSSENETGPEGHEAMKSSSTIGLASVVLLLQFQTFGADVVPYDHDVDHGRITLLNENGFWSEWATEFPIVGGWMSSGEPVGTGNGPHGSIWFHVIEQGAEVGELGVWDTPITTEQFDSHSGLDIRIGWGIWYVYGENRVLGYDVINHLDPYPLTYALSYSAGVIPEPSPTRLLLSALVLLLMFRATVGQRTKRASVSSASVSSHY